MTDRAVVLVSGGLDSATCLAIARDQGYACFALSFEYGQRSVSEFAVVKSVVETQGVIEQSIVSPGLDELGGSALTDKIWRFLKRDGRYSCYLCSSEKYRVSVLRLSH